MTNEPEIQTLPATQEQDMRAIQNLFQRAANVIVEASNLGAEVKALRTQVETLLSDTERMREHITWLEQENTTLRTQRDEAQNALSDTRQDLDNSIKNHNNLELVNKNLTANIDKYREDVTFWENEADRSQTSLKEAQTEIYNLKKMLNHVWDGIKDHFQEPQAPKAEPRPLPEATATPSFVAPPIDRPYSHYDEPKF